MSEEKKRKKFTSNEEIILLDLIKKYANIIECKESNAQLWEEKQRIWLVIEEEFNSISDIQRSAKCLRTKYENMKKKSNKRNRLRRLGSSINESDKKSSPELEVHEHFMCAFLDQQTRLRSDEDNEEQDEASEENYQESECIKTNGTKEEIAILQQDEPIKSFKREITSPLTLNHKTKRKFQVKEEWAELYKLKKNLVEIQIQNEIERHDKQMEYMREEHELKMRLIQNNS